MGTTDTPRSQRLYYGTRDDLKPGDRIEPGVSLAGGEQDGALWVELTPDLDGAIWSAELAAGEGPGRVYLVEPVGAMEPSPEPTGQLSPGSRWAPYRSREPLRVVAEVTEWLHYHGTRAALEPGDLIGVAPVSWTLMLL